MDYCEFIESPILSTGSFKMFKIQIKLQFALFEHASNQMSKATKNLST